MSYGMFTPEGNELVHNIVKAGARLHTELGDSIEQCRTWVYHNLVKLSRAEGYGEATDTEVRELSLNSLDRMCGK